MFCESVIRIIRSLTSVVVPLDIMYHVMTALKFAIHVLIHNRALYLSDSICSPVVLDLLRCKIGRDRSDGRMLLVCSWFPQSRR